MDNSGFEKDIINDTPDYDAQLEILQEEKTLIRKRRRWYTAIFSVLVFVVAIIFVSYSALDVYHEYGNGNGQDNCLNVNLKINGSPVPNLNLTEGNTCKPVYNIDYFNNKIPIFNIDLYGDKTRIFNATNQMDSTGSYCILNCDSNNDGWPDYNLDLNGDGIADLNITKNPAMSSICDLNCDLNHDMLPDINIDTNGDGNPDVNITSGNDSIIPIYNVDYKGNREPTFNILQPNGSVVNPITQVNQQSRCTTNCDIDGDGWPDYNIVIGNNLSKLNEKAGGKTINIDIDGDGNPDVNISSDGGNTITNGLNIESNGITLNVDTDGDGVPDINIDINGDGTPDLNIYDNNVCVKNCDTNGDGKAEDNVTYGHNEISVNKIDIDVDYDGICDVNCDINYDLIPDINVDLDGDNVPDINIDYDHNGIPDFNIDTNKDNKPDINLDAYKIGECNFNCENSNIVNPVNSGNTCTKNCDTNNDGWPDTNVDINGDGTCDLNCNGVTNDNNHNYIKDTDEQASSININASEEYDVLISNPLDIAAIDIEPGWNGKYIISITNNSYYAVAYELKWTNVLNEFTDINNLDYKLVKNNFKYLDNQKAPKNSKVLGTQLLARSKSKIQYVMDLNFTETGINQNIDSGKTFKGKLLIEIIK